MVLLFDDVQWADADSVRLLRLVLPICDADGALLGMLTDRDIVVRAVADGKDPQTTAAGELAEDTPVTIGVDDPVEDAMETMQEFQVRRLPVVDGDRLVGIISEADVARNAAPDDVAVTVQSITN